MIANQDAVLGPQGAEAQSERLGVLGLTRPQLRRTREDEGGTSLSCG
jgi:hypothetical protein